MTEANNKWSKWYLVVYTTKYAGNFERQMCAFMTGVVGDCGVGKEQAEAFYASGCGDENLEYADPIAFSDGCHRPVEVFGDGHALRIGLDRKPTDEEIEFLKARAHAWDQMVHGHKCGFEIVKFTLIEERTEATEAEV